MTRVPRWSAAILVLSALLALVACSGDPPASPHATRPGEGSEVAQTVDSASPDETPATEEGGVPVVDTIEMEPQVAERLEETRAAVLENPASAAAWGEFGKVAHAHELWEAARVAYAEAWALDPTDVRWPYYLGDVLSVVSSDPAEAVRAFRRALELDPDYAPAHMRLGRVLVAADEPEAAAEHFERALELAPNLQPARVALAQVRLAQGELDIAQELLETVLDATPRNAQALTTLGQVYMRRGRRDEAREVAARAAAAAEYNLFTDPRMGEVVQEGISSVLLWDRAKAFFDNDNFEQAARGLERVVALRPDNVEARHQLAVALGNIGRTELSLPHLEKVVESQPDLVDARVRLATVLLDLDRPASAVPHLRRALELSPDDPDAGWLLGRALLRSGAVQRALETFESTRAGGRSVPGWIHADWGNALAQTGRVQEALEQFHAALRADPNDAQALFYVGLIHEGSGRVEEAIEHYCRSMRAQPNPPAAGRLQALGRNCG